MAEEKKEGAPKNPGLIKKILTFGFIGLNVVVTGIGAFLVYSNTIGYNPPILSEQDAFAKIEKENVFAEGEPIVYSMEPFVLNLSGVPKRVIRLAVNLEMLDEQGFEEVLSLGARGRDAVVKILNEKRFQDLERIQGKLMLKEEIALTLNQLLKKGVVRNVYFSDFVVQ